MAVLSSESDRRSSSAEATSSGAHTSLALGEEFSRQLQCRRVTDSFSAPLERTALRRGRYRESVKWSVLAAATFNLCSVVSLGSYGLRGDSPWRELYYVSTALCLAYALSCQWSLREKPGEQFKAFVLQEGFVYSCMLEMFTWTWISIVFTLSFLVVTWGSLLFHFSGSSLPGSRHFLWSFAYLVNLPTLLRLDPLTSSATFKSAAVKKGYPGAAFTHVGFSYRFALSAISCPLFLVVWLLLCFPDGLFSQSEYDMYFLYGQAAVLTGLLLLIWLPRYANTVKSREVLEEQYNTVKASPTIATNIKSTSRWRRFWAVVLGGAYSGAAKDDPPHPAPLGINGVSLVSTLSRVDETASLRNYSAGHHGGHEQRPPGVNNSECGQDYEVSVDVTDTDYKLPSNFSCRSNIATEDDHCHQHPALMTPLPGSSTVLPGAVVAASDVPAFGEQRPLAASVSLPAATSSRSLLRCGGDLGDSAKIEQQPSALLAPSSSVGDVAGAGDILPTGSVALTSKSSSTITAGAFAGIVGSFIKPRVGRSSASSTMPPSISSNSVACLRGVVPRNVSSSVEGRATSTTRLSTRLLFRPSGGAVEEVTNSEARSFRELFPESSSRSEHIFAKSLGEKPRMKNEAAHFGERAGDELSENVVESVEILGYTSSRNPLLGKGQNDPYYQSQSHYFSHAMRASGSVLEILVAGVRGLPQGTYMLCVNVLAAVHHFKDNWRWWAATKTEKFLVTTGFLVVCVIKCPTVEVPITTSLPALVLACVALAWAVALNTLVVLGKYDRASEAMILEEVRKGGNIGSGLVFSTASILNALTFDEPVEQGFVATEWELVHTAVISCRWDTDASWELEVREGRGRTRTCRVMFPRVQLYRAALAARLRNCDYMWVDCMSVPQLSPSDPHDVAETKTAAIRRLIPTMTAVYASAQLVLVLETACGQEDGPDAYSKRTWTLQECVINQCTELVHLDGRHTVLGDASSRRMLSGLTDDELAAGMDDLASYKWVLEGEERAAAAETTPAQRRNFSTFADSRTAWRAADKAVALGQIFFRVLFEHVDVATEFIMEVATLLAKHCEHSSVMLIDNTGWDDVVMTGSACKTRYLMGKPSVMESGPPAMWHILRVRNSQSETGEAATTGSSTLRDRIDSASSVMENEVQPYRGMAAMLFASDEAEEAADSWWLCQILLQDQRVPVAVLPGQLHAGGHVGHLRKLRTCTAEERATIRNAKDLESTKVLWM